MAIDGGFMKEKQVIVQWYDHEESYPEKEGIYICSCEVDQDDISFRGVFIPCYWSEETGWITPEAENLKIVAWCDLKPYK